MCVGGGKLERGHRDEVMKGLKSYAKYWYFIPWIRGHKFEYLL